MLRLLGLGFDFSDLEEEEVALTAEQQDAADCFKEKVYVFGGLAAAVTVLIIVSIRSILGV